MIHHRSIRSDVERSDRLIKAYDGFCRACLITGRMLVILLVAIIVGAPWLLGVIGIIGAILR